MDDDSSFSEGEEEDEEEEEPEMLGSALPGETHDRFAFMLGQDVRVVKRRMTSHINPSLSLAALPRCILAKEILRDGLKVLISKEDELLYAAYVHTLDLPDM